MIVFIFSILYNSIFFVYMHSIHNKLINARILTKNELSKSVTKFNLKLIDNENKF